MNRYTQSAECLHRMHADCNYEDCACRCHLQDDEPEAFDPDDNRYKWPEDRR